MSVLYPTNIDTPLTVNVGDTIQPDNVNDLYLGVQAIETKVGVTGSENFVLVAGDTMTGALTGTTISATTLIGNTTVRGTTVSGTTISGNTFSVGSAINMQSSGTINVASAANPINNIYAATYYKNGNLLSSYYVPATGGSIAGTLNATTVSGTTISGVSNYFTKVYITPSTPTSGSAVGVPGQIAVDGAYIYICSGANLWGRVRFSTW